MPDGPLGDQSIDPLVIWVFVAGVVIALLLVLSTAAFKSDRSGLALSPPSPPTAKTDCQKAGGMWDAATKTCSEE